MNIGFIRCMDMSVDRKRLSSFISAFIYIYIVFFLDACKKYECTCVISTYVNSSLLSSVFYQLAARSTQPLLIIRSISRRRVCTNDIVNIPVKYRRMYPRNSWSRADWDYNLPLTFLFFFIFFLSYTALSMKIIQFTKQR